MTLPMTIKNWIDNHAVDYELLPHVKSASSHETALAAHVMDDHIAKAVLVKDSTAYAMVVIPASDWLKLKTLHEETDREFELADESEVISLFNDCQPGAIPPIGPAYNIETYIDERLTTLANVFFEAGDHEQLVHVTGEGFQRLIKGARHGHFSHSEW